MASLKENVGMDIDHLATTEDPPSQAVIHAISMEEDLLLNRRSPENEPRATASPARLATMLAINASSVLEKTDEQLLPAVYKYVGCSFNDATPGTLSHGVGSVRFSKLWIHGGRFMTVLHHQRFK